MPYPASPAMKARYTRSYEPGVLSLVARLLFVVVGPANVVIDLSRQAIRDELAHTRAT